MGAIYAAVGEEDIHAGVGFFMMQRGSISTLQITLTDGALARKPDNSLAHPERLEWNRSFELSFTTARGKVDGTGGSRRLAMALRPPGPAPQSQELRKGKTSLASWGKRQLLGHVFSLCLAYSAFLGELFLFNVSRANPSIAKSEKITC